MAEIVLPRLGWAMEQGIFMGWLKHNGESVKAGESLFGIEGDKSYQEIEAIESGTLRIPAGGPKNGDTIPVGAVLGYIEVAGQTWSPGVAVGSQHASAEKPVPSRQVTTENSIPTAAQGLPVRQAVTPRARKAAKDHAVDIGSLAGTGRNGRILERDVLSSAEATPAQPASPLRQVIAQRMVHSLRTVAPVTLTSTVDAENLMNLRNQFKTIGTAKESQVPSFTDFFIKLAAIALLKHPDLNSRWEQNGIVKLAEINIGLAVDTPAGLLVPVVRNVPSLSLRQLASRTAALIEKAISRHLKPSELQGGTFTVTSLGNFGIDAFTPIINWPECAILGIGEIRKRAVVLDDQIVARYTATLSLTFDHRLIDGAPAARFLQSLRSGVENPSAQLLEQVS